MNGVIFDLDDTLYPEREYVESGFRAVARALARRHRRDEPALFARMLEILDEQGRGHVFDAILREIDCLDDDEVRLMVYVYRSHKPDIRLFPDTLPVLASLRADGVRLGLVTDGLGSVQRGKIAALGLEPHLDAVVCSDDIGQQWWKPSATPFRVALALLDVSPENAAYVGNDPTKDFLAPNVLGMASIQIASTHPSGSAAGSMPVATIATLADLPDVVASLRTRRKDHHGSRGGGGRLKDVAWP